MSCCRLSCFAVVVQRQPKLYRMDHRSMRKRVNKNALYFNSFQVFTIFAKPPYSHFYTVSQKTIHLTFDHNFGRCGPIFKILLLTDSQENSLCSYCRVFHLTLTVLLHYLVKLENYSCCRFQWRIAGETS